MNFFSKLLLIILASVCLRAQLIAEEVQIEGTITVSNTSFDYKEWKMRKLLMQLSREKNNVVICSLLQPAAVFGSVFFSAATVGYILAILTGNGDRHSGKDLVKSIQSMIELIKAPFTLQYKKNKARDAIEDIKEEIATREVVTHASV